MVMVRALVCCACANGEPIGVLVCVVAWEEFGIRVRRDER
jgi:hypothetical protein